MNHRRHNNEAYFLLPPGAGPRVSLQLVQFMHRLPVDDCTEGSTCTAQAPDDMSLWPRVGVCDENMVRALSRSRQQLSRAAPSPPPRAWGGRRRRPDAPCCTAGGCERPNAAQEFLPLLCGGMASSNAAEACRTRAELATDVKAQANWLSARGRSMV